MLFSIGRARKRFCLSHPTKHTGFFHLRGGPSEEVEGVARRLADEVGSHAVAVLGVEHPRKAQAVDACKKRGEAMLLFF